MSKDNRISDRIDKALIEGRFFNHMRQMLWHGICWRCAKLERKIDFALGKAFRNKRYKNTPIQDNRIVFCAFQGDYTDNPKYITEELIRRNTNCEIIWLTREDVAQHPELFPEQVSHLYEWWTEEAFEALASAKVLVVNSVELFKQPYPKKKGQYIIETWHGSLGIKRFDKEVNSGKAWVKAAELTTKICDYLISNSTFETDIYRKTFWPTQEIWEVGHPRNDCIVCCDDTTKAAARERLFQFAGIEDHGEKLVLYAPTFRDSKEFSCYNLEPRQLLDALEKRFGGKWLALYRYHPTVRIQAASHKNLWESIVDLTHYPDMQDLLQVADIGITDYSSWIFDFMLTGRPGFIYATDIALYNNERGFVYPLETTPFPIATDNAEMQKNILAFDEQKYAIEHAAFLKEKGCCEDGHASEKVVDKILQLMKENSN